MSYNWEKWNEFSGKRESLNEVSGKDIRALEKNLSKTYDAYVHAIEDIQEVVSKELGLKLMAAKTPLPAGNTVFVASPSDMLRPSTKLEPDSVVTSPRVLVAPMISMPLSSNWKPAILLLLL